MSDWLDGKKRCVLLAVFVIQSIAQLARGGDVVEVTRALPEWFGFNPSYALVFALIVVQLVLAIYAIADGLRKDREQRDQRARIMR